MIAAGGDKPQCYREQGWWANRTLADMYLANAARHPDRLALADAPDRADFAFGQPQRLTKVMRREVRERALAAVEGA